MGSIGWNRLESVGIGWERMGRTREREERAEDERERERIEARRASRVSGRAEVTVRCENSFESSPRLIVEEGRSSTGLLCRSCSPLFPPCSCYPNRKVGIAITIVRSFQPEIRASIYRYLLIGNIFIYGETRSLSATLFSKNSSLREVSSLEIRF